MPRNYTPKEVHTPKSRISRVSEKMRAGYGLLEAEKIEQIGYDDAQAEVNAQAVASLCEMLEKRCGFEADKELSENLISSGFSRVKVAGIACPQWKKEGVLLESPDGQKRFPKYARRLEAQKKMRHVLRYLDGSGYIRGTPDDFRLAVLNAFEAGVALGESAQTNVGRKKDIEAERALHAYFEEVVKDNGCAMRVKAILPLVDLEKVRAIIPKPKGRRKNIDLTTLENKIRHWIGLKNPRI